MCSVENNHVIIEKITIEQFRRFNNVEFEIGKNITLIAGQNGTGKSTLLGMLCQPFSFGVHQGKTAYSKDNSKYTTNYHGINLAQYRDITGSTFFYDCEDVFRLSNQHDTFLKNYSYRLYLSGSCITNDSPIFEDGLLVRSQKRKSQKREGIRFVAAPRVSSEAGEGNFPHPVIYLGLSRLWPLALTNKIEVDNTPAIKDEDKDWYVKKYNEILVLEEYDNTTEFLKTGKGGPKQDFIGTSSNDYDSESCSAGQDNLGQILTSILSFRHLKSELGDKYQGGILLIDELDTTFHAKAQQRLLETLYEISEELKLQIIATTHSTHLLRQAYHSGLKTHTNVLYLKKHGNKIIDSGFTSFKEVEDNLNVEATPLPRKTTRKVSIFFEDSVGKNMFFSIIGKSLDKYLNRIDMESFDAGSLINMANLSTRVPELKAVLFIPDGDVKEQSKSSNKNLIFLPGDCRPETLIYKNLKDTDDDDPFWSKCNSSYSSYTRQVAITGEGSPSAINAKKWYKDWYKKQSPYWGTTNKIAFEKWARDNKVECENFCREFFKILKRVSPEQIPKDVFRKILKKYE